MRRQPRRRGSRAAGRVVIRTWRATSWKETASQGGDSLIRRLLSASPAESLFEELPRLPMRPQYFLLPHRVGEVSLLVGLQRRDPLIDPAEEERDVVAVDRVAALAD